MGDENLKIQPFVRNEAYVSLTDGSYGDYCGVGLQTKTKAGDIHLFVAGRATNNYAGGFGEIRYTSPEIAPNIHAQVNNRYSVTTKGNNNATRIAGVYADKINDVSIYEICGGHVVADKTGVKGVGPISFTGVGYQVTDNLNIYGELEMSKSYNPQNNSWGDFSFGLTFGIKYTF